MARLIPHKPLRWATGTAAVGLALALTGCGGSSSNDNNDSTDARTGQLGSIPIEGLSYRTDSETGTTNSQGEYRYREGETVTFAVGDLELGSVAAGQQLTLPDLAGDITDDLTGNLAVLLQALDQDGNLNNGIRITNEASAIVNDYADLLILDQPTNAFTNSQALADLLADLNAAGEAVFNDTDPRERRLQSAADARGTLTRALSDRRVVSTTYGELRGFTTPDESAWSWYGVPYATTPLGELRWKPPVAPGSWSGVRDAIAWADQSAQDPAMEAFGEGGMSEDSLYLNVTVPKDQGDDPLPVMVWFHGGGFSILTGNTRGFNNTSLPNAGVVVVTVNHRLGPMGYLAHPALSEESAEGASGNYGQLDLVAALNWVQDNIAEFGGDPGNVTIFGESGGGGKVLSLLHSPLAESLFHKAIVQSGMAAPGDPTIPVQITQDIQEAEGEKLVEALGLEGEEDVLAALRATPWPEIVQAAGSSGFAARPNIDGWYKTMSIRDAFEAGAHHDVPIISGANTGDYPGLIAGLKWYMPWLATANESDVFTYVFDHVPAGWRARGTPSYHGIELVYVFDYPGSFAAHYLLGLSEHEDPTIEKFATVDAPGIDPAEYATVSSNTVAMWANFARTGNPSLTDIQWPAYTEANDTYLKIGLTPETGIGLDDAFPEPSED